MSNSQQDQTSGGLTRRAALLGAPAVTLGAIGLGFGLSGKDSDTPTAIESSGPFRAVYLTPRDDQTHVDAFLMYPFGERHNPYAEGLAHYLEHLAWNNMISEGQDSGHHSNALTSNEATGYWLQRAPSELSEVILRLIASAKPLAVSEAYAVQERDIVQREFDLRVLDNPLHEVWTEGTKALYGDGPYARTPIGTKASINTYSLDAARRLHDETHQIEFATLLLRGPISERNVTTALDQIAERPTPRSAPLATDLPVWPEQPSLTLTKHVLPKISSEEVIVRRSFLPPGGFTATETMAARNILQHLALSTKPGGLAKPLRFDNFLSRSFDFGLYALGDAGFEIWLTAIPDAGVSPETLHAGIDEHLEAMLSEPNPQGFADIKDRELADLDGILDPLEQNDDLLFNALLKGTPFVPISELRDATAHLTHARFSEFTNHFRQPRSSTAQLVYKSFPSDG